MYDSYTVTFSSRLSDHWKDIDPPRPPVCACARLPRRRAACPHIGCEAVCRCDHFTEQTVHTLTRTAHTHTRRGNLCEIHILDSQQLTSVYIDPRPISEIRDRAALGAEVNPVWFLKIDQVNPVYRVHVFLKSPFMWERQTMMPLKIQSAGKWSFFREAWENLFKKKGKARPNEGFHSCIVVCCAFVARAILLVSASLCFTSTSH